MIRHKTFGFLLICLTTLLGLSKQQVKADLFPLSIIHINDFHARFEATDTGGGTCNDNKACIGVKRLLEELKDTNAVYFNAGDSFQGTLWYNIGRWNVTSQFLNMLPADAMTLGNHEFDHGVEGVVPFLESLNTTMLVANMDSTNEPEMTGKYQKSMIIERSNRKIGVIGVILETTYDLANTGNLIFRNESVAIVEEAEKLKSQGANIIIVISHCGYEVDKLIAEHAGSEIDVIVGSHSHTFLYTGDNPPGPDTPKGDYPTQVTHASGHRVLIVQAGAYAKYVGNLTVYFDDDGNVVDFEGAPIYMSNSVPEDAEVVDALQPWKVEVDAKGKVVVGETLVDLVKYPCSSAECNLGNYFCDAMVHAYLHLAPYEDKAWTQVPIGLVNTGALRVPLYRGNLTYSHIVAMSPFENILTAFDLPGERLLEALEFGASKIDYANGENSSYIFLQVSGLKVTYDFKKPMYERVVDMKVRCGNCTYPRYEPFDINSTYRIVAPNFLQDGGDGYYMFREYGTNVQPYVTDLDALLITYNKEIKEFMPTWKNIIETAGSAKIGETIVNLEHTECEYKECNIGNFYTDAMLNKLMSLSPYNSSHWTNVSIALAAAGELYLTLPRGAITYGQVYSLCPFEAPLVAFDLEGVHLKAALEKSVSRINFLNKINATNTFLQVSGLKVIYNLWNPVNKRVLKVKVRCAHCKVPIYENLDINKVYRILTTRYVAGGGYGFSMFKQYGQNRQYGLYNGIHFSVTEALKPWRQEIESVGNRVIGRSAVYLQQKECSTGECNLGNFVTDAMLHAFLEEQNYDGPNWSNITIAFTAQSHFRVPLQPGNITYNHLITMCPWENDIFVSGLKVVYNITNPIGQRVQDLRVRCQECVVPRYVNLDLEKDYKVVLMDYLANGKDGFNLIKENAKDFRRGPGDLDALMKFLKIHDPVVAGIEGRIKVVY
ncbi:Apyrase [Lucilia cuprina]|nr:Apyrase [Lucilia cuprina]